MKWIFIGMFTIVLATLMISSILIFKVKIPSLRILHIMDGEEKLIPRTNPWYDVKHGSLRIASDEDIVKWRSVVVERNVWPHAPENNLSEIKRFNAAPPIRVMFWNLKGDFGHYWSGNKPFLEYNCPVHSCLMVNGKRDYMSTEVIVFRKKGEKNLRIDSVPETRRPDQKYLLYLHGPQCQIVIPENITGIFNITMTPRLDSDIPHPYGSIVPRTPIASNRGKDINHAVGKTKLIAWVSSHCKTQSMREIYAEELRKYIPIDVFGKCGTTKNCTPKHSDLCLENVNKTYKFYLSFENSLCKDYLTEKIFHMLHRGGIVPIVLGAVDYSKHLPPHSYIDVKDFKSPKHLADYLWTLHRNDTLYNAYFRWQKYFQVRLADEVEWRPIYCRMCEYLQRMRNVVSTYSDVDSWWRKDNCISLEQYYRTHTTQEFLTNISRKLHERLKYNRTRAFLINNFLLKAII